MKISLGACVAMVAAASAAAAAADDKGVIPSTLSGSYTIGPSYTSDPAVAPCLDCERGATFHLEMPIAESAYYNCNPDENPFLTGTCADGVCGQQYGTPGTRNITVYVPAAYDDDDDAGGDEIGVLVTQDGTMPYGPDNTFGSPVDEDSTMFSRITNIMDHMIDAPNAERSLPPFVLVSVDLAGPGAYGRYPDGDCGNEAGTERSNEYVTVSEDYARFVSEEVLPFVANHPNVRSQYPNLVFTDDPAGRASYGGSDGGATAVRMAFFTPHLFGIAIGYNAGLIEYRYETLPSKATYPKGSAELWVPETEGGQELIRKEDLKPIRVFHNAGQNDAGTPNACIELPGIGKVDMPANASNSFLEANNMTHAAFTEKGYDTRYAYALNSCHTQTDVVLQDLPNTLVWAWSHWKAKKNKNTAPADTRTSSAFPLAIPLTTAGLLFLLVGVLAVL